MSRSRRRLISSDAAKHEVGFTYIEQRNFGKPWESSKAVVAGDIRRSDGKVLSGAERGHHGDHQAHQRGRHLERRRRRVELPPTPATASPGSARSPTPRPQPPALSLARACPTNFPSRATRARSLTLRRTQNVITMTEGPTGNIQMHKTAHGMSSANNGIALVEFTTGFAGYYESKALRATVVDVDNIDIDYSYAEATARPTVVPPSSTSTRSLLRSRPACPPTASSSARGAATRATERGVPLPEPQALRRHTRAATHRGMSRSNSYTDFTGTIPRWTTTRSPSRSRPVRSTMCARSSAWTGWCC